MLPQAMTTLLPGKYCTYLVHVRFLQDPQRSQLESQHLTNLLE